MYRQLGYRVFLSKSIYRAQRRLQVQHIRQVQKVSKTYIKKNKGSPTTQMVRHSDMEFQVQEAVRSLLMIM